MAVSLPSDIVLDVMKAADPQAARDARQTLAAKATAVASPAFEPSLRVAAGPASKSPGQIPAPPENDVVARDFRAMVLQNLLKEMLPAGTTLGGKGMAGDMWESMFIDKVAEAAAARDALGLNSRLLADTVMEGDSATVLGGVRDFRNAVAETATRDVSSAFLAGLQRAALSTISGRET